MPDGRGPTKTPKRGPLAATKPPRSEGRPAARRSQDAAARPGARQRLSPSERREHILREAIRYFSEVGFDGGTRDLANRIGVKQPLIYRYFPSKEDLIREVYESVYIGRWRHDLDETLGNRAIPIRERLIDFYKAYAEIMFQPEWIRIYFFSGLKGLDINKRYVAFMEDRVLSRICEEIRESFGLPSFDQVPLHPEELGTFWVFHGGIFYYGVRREVYGVPVHVDLDEYVELSVDAMLTGYPAVARRILTA